jgi:FkbM family methyltransferase
MQTIITLSEKFFRLIAPLLKPKPIQKFFRELGVRLPYRYAKYLDYREIVNFMVGDREILMLSQNTPIEITAFWRGIFGGREGAELRVWYALSKKVNLILDIGANTGVYSLVAATNNSARVYAFEPVPIVFNLLEENIGLNKFNNIKPQQKVVSEINGDIDLYIPKEGWVDVSSVEKSHASKYASDETLKKLVCQSVTIDSFLSESGHTGELVLAKVDVEGAEKKVIQGMASIIENKKIIVLAELLNKAAYDEVVGLLPETYSVYGVVGNKPYTKKTEGYVKGIKNYFLLPSHCVHMLDTNNR